MIDYEPDSKKIKLSTDLLPETLLQSPKEAVDDEAEELMMGESVDVAPQTINFEMMLKRIHEFQRKLDMDEFKGKSTEMLVCSVCYSIHRNTDGLREHYMTVRIVHRKNKST